MSDKNIRETLANVDLKNSFEEVCPKWMDYTSQKAFAIQIVEATDANKSGSLHNIAIKNPRQLTASMYNVAACGLSLDPARKEAYLTVRRGAIIMDPSYIGMCRLATDTGSILWVKADTVKKNDKFKIVSVDEKPIHEHDPFSSDRGATVGYYCTVKVHNGDYLTTAMSMDEIEKIKGAGSGGNVWNQWPDEMGKKSVIRRAHKLWPVSNNHEASERLAAAVHVGDLNEGMTAIASAPDLGSYDETIKYKFDRCITDSDAVEMTLLKHSLSETQWSNLYHSFTTAKGKYQRIVDGLYQSGEAMVREYVDIINEAVASGGDLDSALEEMGELRPLVEARVSNEAAQVMRAA